MRIISGEYQNKKVLNYQDNAIRPTMDRAKEGIFNIINYHIEDKVFIDVFSGTGNIGIEALSRGASIVYFVDKNRDSIKLIKSNLEGIDKEYYVVQSDAYNYAKECEIKFDYIYLDPPYDINIDSFKDIVDLFSNNLKLNGQLIIELGKEYPFEIDTLIKLKTRKYGKTIYTIFKKDADE